MVKAKAGYKLWHDGIINLTRVDRYTIGCKIDDIFLSLLSLIFRGCYAGDKFEKLSIVSEAIANNDQLKFFLQLGWEQKVVDHKQYATLIVYLDEIGRMLGGWKNSLKEKTPTRK